MISTAKDDSFYCRSDCNDGDGGENGQSFTLSLILHKLPIHDLLLQVEHLPPQILVVDFGQIELGFR